MELSEAAARVQALEKRVNEQAGRIAAQSLLLDAVLQSIALENLAQIELVRQYFQSDASAYQANGLQKTGFDSAVRDIEQKISRLNGDN